jgi:hypothetical protein
MIGLNLFHRRRKRDEIRSPFCYIMPSWSRNGNPIRHREIVMRGLMVLIVSSITAISIATVAWATAGGGGPM